MSTVQQVFNDLLTWVKQSPSDGTPAHVVAFQHVSIGGAAAVDFGYGVFASATPVSVFESFLTGSYEQAASNLRYHQETGKWQKLDGSGIMNDFGSENLRLQFANGKLLFTLADGVEIPLSSVDERDFAFVGESPNTNRVFVLSYVKTTAPSGV